MTLFPKLSEIHLKKMQLQEEEILSQLVLDLKAYLLKHQWHQDVKYFDQYNYHIV